VLRKSVAKDQKRQYGFPDAGANTHAQELETPPLWPMADFEVLSYSNRGTSFGII
jgi:hypothetical protein